MTVRQSPFRCVCFGSLIACAPLALHAQATGVWAPGFDHKNQLGAAAPHTQIGSEVEFPPVPIADWLTLNKPDGRDMSVPPSSEKMNALHACLIPAGPHRGEVLVWDGNLREFGIPSGNNGFQQRIRDKQPWAIVNPYWPDVNPWSTIAPASQHRFYNRTLTLPRDPVTNANLGELFCGGQTWLNDGRLFVAGGTMRYPTTVDGGDFLGSKLTWTFDPVLVAWTQQPSLEVRRWYPFVTYDGTLPGRALIIGGSDDFVPSTPGLPPAMEPHNHYEAYDTGNATCLPESKLPAFPPVRLYSGLPPSRSFSDYPRVHILTTGQAFVSGFEARGARWTHNPAQDPVYLQDTGLNTPVITSFGTFELMHVHYATDVYFPEYDGIVDMVARLGGARAYQRVGTGVFVGFISRLGETCAASNPASPAWDLNGLPPMVHQRDRGNVVVLPSKELFAIGGLEQPAPSLSNPNPVPIPVSEPELLQDTANGKVWTPMATHVGDDRWYHSCALLLPDARVLCCGGEAFGNGVRPSDYRIWTPPYLTSGRPRPTGLKLLKLNGTPISDTLQGGLTQGQQFLAICDQMSVDLTLRVVLVRPEAVTHHDDGGQRWIEPSSVATSSPISNTLAQLCTMPTNQFEALRGWYMVFLVTSEGVPSDATWVHVK